MLGGRCIYWLNHLAILSTFCKTEAKNYRLMNYVLAVLFESALNINPVFVL